MYLSTCSEWLSWIGALHPSEIELGLDRVKVIAARLKIAPACPVIIVGGTNGKGSTVAGLESIYRAAGYRVGAFTSPFLFRYNEQIRIHDQEVSDASLCRAFAHIESMRGDVSLTAFEFSTLAAFVLFQEQALDVWILEVGLGGRLDAVNILDADVAVVTSIGIDHTEWLGSTREAIAIEKAGIFRWHKPVVSGDSETPASLIAAAEALQAPLHIQGQTFHYEQVADSWSWYSGTMQYKLLPSNALAIQNMSVVLMVVTLLQQRLSVSRSAIDQGLSQVTLTGRIQHKMGSVNEIYDVSHNPAAAAFLSQHLIQMPCSGKRRAIFSMLGDKDILATIKAICKEIDEWYVAPLTVKRAADRQQLKEAFQAAGVKAVNYYPALEMAYETALLHSKLGDDLIIFGSFHTVASILRLKPPTS